LQALCENICSGRLAMIVDDNFVGIVMFALVGVIYLAYKVGEYVGQTKK
jgi:hypothetical protein